MQEKINGFQKVSQIYNGNRISTEINGSDVKISGPNYIDIIAPVKVNGLVNGYGSYHYLIGEQPVYVWERLVTLTADNVGDDVTLYDGTSLSQDLNPVARLYGDNFENCVIWPLGVEIYGNGYDGSNYISATLITKGTNWLYNGLTYSIRTSYVYSYTCDAFQTLQFNYPFKADSSVITTEVDSLSSSGSPAANDKEFNILIKLACQKINS